MKRFLSAFFWILLMLLTLAGCQGGEASPEDLEEDLEEDLIVVGVSQVGAESDWRVASSESLKNTFTEENGYRLLFEDAQQKPEKQILAIRRFIQLGVDYIVLLPIVEDGWEAVFQEAAEAGIPILVVDRSVNVDPSLYKAHIGADFRREGEMAVQWLEGRFKEEESVSIVHLQGTPGSTAQVGRTAALEEALLRNENWQLLAQMDGDFTQAKSYEVMVELLREQNCPPIDLVYCENDNEAFGTIKALEEFGYVCGPDGVTVVSFDGTRTSLQWCMEGKISLVVECNPLLGPMTAEVIEKLEAGEPVRREYHMEDQYFTPNRLTEEYIQQRPY